MDSTSEGKLLLQNWFLDRGAQLKKFREYRHAYNDQRVNVLNLSETIPRLSVKSQVV